MCSSVQLVISCIAALFKLACMHVNIVPHMRQPAREVLSVMASRRTMKAPVARLSLASVVTVVLAVALATVPVEGDTRKYTLNIAAGQTAPDGFSRIACLINGQFPGPVITGNRGEQNFSAVSASTVSAPHASHAAHTCSATVRGRAFVGVRQIPAKHHCQQDSACPACLVVIAFSWTMHTCSSSCDMHACIPIQLLGMCGYHVFVLQLLDCQ
jgi:hypothetical protein